MAVLRPGASTERMTSQFGGCLRGRKWPGRALSEEGASSNHCRVTPPTASSTASSDATAPAGTAAPDRTATATIVVADQRPLVRAGLRAVAAAAEGIALAAAVGVDRLVAAVEEHAPAVLVVGVGENDPEPFQAIATATALHEDLRVLAIADSATVVDLREAVVAGVDSFLVSTAGEAEIRDAITDTANGQRVVSPSVAMQLAGSWRPGGGEEPIGGVTPRELEVLQLLAEGLTNKQVGKRLGISARTVKTHVQNLLSKLDVPDRTGAVARAFRLGLIR